MTSYWHKAKGKKLRTKNEIKVDRLLSLGIGFFGLIGFGYFYRGGELIQMLICFLAILFMGRADGLNNDLEYGRYKTSKGENTK